jgi:HAD superfamily hydrolase (TIGR01509 family)
MAIRTLIFDFDGTLVDSEFAHEQATYQFLQQLRVSIPAGNFVGKGLREFLNALKAKHAQLDQSIEELTHLYGEIMMSLAGKHIHPYDKSINFARAAKAKGYTVAIASGTHLDLLQHLVAAFGMSDIFGEHVYSSEHDAAGKPAPDLFLRVAKILQVPVTEILVLEDSHPGYLAAKAAQMHVLMVPDPRYSVGKDFNDAHLLFDTPNNLEADVVFTYCDSH